MATILKIFVILALVVALLGGAGYFYYSTQVKPKKLDLAEKKVIATQKPLPPPDPSLPAFNKIQPHLDKDTIEVRDELLAFIKDFPDSPKAADVRKAIGRINVALVLSPVPLPDKSTYTVQKGDSLSKIATKQKSGAELIYRANNLQTINLKIGQELVIPKLDTAILIDRAKMRLVLSNGGQFFKEYPIKSLKVAGAHGNSTIETKVLSREAFKGTNRISFGSKDYDDSERRIILSLAGNTIRPTEADKSADDAASGILLDPTDSDEVYFLTTRGTPVTIK